MARAGSTWKHWTVEEFRWLSQNFTTAAWEDILKALPGRSKGAIQTQAAKMGLERGRVKWLNRHEGREQYNPPRYIKELRKLRIEMGLSQKDVAEIAGFSCAAIGFWEQGRIVPKMVNLLRWCDALEAELTIGEKEHEHLE